MKVREGLKEIRAKNTKELSILLKKEYETLRKLRFEWKMRELKDVTKIKKTKKKIARMMTVLREKIGEGAQK